MAEPEETDRRLDLPATGVLPDRAAVHPPEGPGHVHGMYPVLASQVGQAGRGSELLVDPITYPGDPPAVRRRGPVSRMREFRNEFLGQDPGHDRARTVGGVHPQGIDHGEATHDTDTGDLIGAGQLRELDDEGARAAVPVRVLVHHGGRFQKQLTAGELEVASTHTLEHGALEHEGRGRMLVVVHRKPCPRRMPGLNRSHASEVPCAKHHAVGRR